MRLNAYVLFNVMYLGEGNDTIQLQKRKSKMKGNGGFGKKTYLEIEKKSQSSTDLKVDSIVGHKK